MCITEYDEVETMNQFREEGREEGREEVIIDMLKKGNSPQAISDFCGYTLSFVTDIQKKMENDMVLA